MQRDMRKSEKETLTVSFTVAVVVVLCFGVLAATLIVTFARGINVERALAEARGEIAAKAELLHAWNATGEGYDTLTLTPDGGHYLVRGDGWVELYGLEQSVPEAFTARVRFTGNASMVFLHTTVNGTERYACRDLVKVTS